jgi:hypothetical protein
VQDWETRVSDAWASIDDYEGRGDEFRALIDNLAAELPDGDPIAAFELVEHDHGSGPPGDDSPGAQRSHVS